MHELGIAQNLVDFVLSEAEKKNATAVKELQIGVGELMQVDARVLSSALRMLMTGQRLEGCKLRVRVEKASFECRKCMASWKMKEAMKQLDQAPESLLVKEPDSRELPLHFIPSLYPTFLHCPKCGSADITTVGGENVRLRRLILE